MYSKVRVKVSKPQNEITFTKYKMNQLTTLTKN